MERYLKNLSLLLATGEPYLSHDLQERIACSSLSSRHELFRGIALLPDQDLRLLVEEFLWVLRGKTDLSEVSKGLAALYQDKLITRASRGRNPQPIQTLGVTLGSLWRDQTWINRNHSVQHRDSLRDVLKKLRARSRAEPIVLTTVNPALRPKNPGWIERNYDEGTCNQSMFEGTSVFTVRRMPLHERIFVYNQRGLGPRLETTESDDVENFLNVEGTPAFILDCNTSYIRGNYLREGRRFLFFHSLLVYVLAALSDLQPGTLTYTVCDAFVNTDDVTRTLYAKPEAVSWQAHYLSIKNRGQLDVDDFVSEDFLFTT